MQPVNLKRILQLTERDYVRTALDATGGNMAAAARIVGYGYYPFRYKVRKYKLKQKENRK